MIPLRKVLKNYCSSMYHKPFVVFLHRFCMSCCYSMSEVDAIRRRHHRSLMYGAQFRNSNWLDSLQESCSCIKSTTSFLTTSSAQRTPRACSVLSNACESYTRKINPILQHVDRTTSPNKMLTATELGYHTMRLALLLQARVFYHFNPWCELSGADGLPQPY
jgi:hypothetical protein